MISAIQHIHLSSAGNLREHWRTRAKRAKEQRLMGRLMASGSMRLFFLQSEGLLFIRFVRVAPRPLDDDNCAFAFKAVRDGVADAFGVSDNHPRIHWEYAQERGKPSQIRIECEIREGR